MRRVAAVTAVLVASAALVLASLGAGEDGETYLVRAIFDNAGFVIPGEDVKVAGVKVGSVDSLDVTRDFKAAVVLRIENPGYRDFRRDARCIVRPQSLIGEKFVECEPTQKRAANAQAPPELERIEDGPGKGQYLLPVENTEQAVDLDLINNTLRLPYRQRLSLIVNELGAAVAGRGEDIRAVIRRANPAFREVDEVLRILASQNKVLQDLARDSDTVLAPLARERRHVSGFIESSSEVAEATGERRDALEANLERLPRFLRELRPTMTRLGALADEMTPVLSDLGDAAPDINRMIIQLGPFSEAGIPALDSLGEAGKVGTPAITRARPIITDLRRLARAVRPVGLTARQVLESFQKNDGIERLMDYIFYQVAAVNGFDAFGHYLRAGLLVNTCSTYTTRPVSGCTANFVPQEAEASTAASTAPRDQVLARTAEALRDALAGRPVKAPPKEEEPRQWEERPARTAAAAPASEPAAEPVARTNAPPADEPLLDYLFGSDG